MELYNGEELKLGKRRIDDNDKMTFEEISQKYYKGQVRIVTEQARYPLNTIVNLINSGNYILKPGFQADFPTKQEGDFYGTAKRIARH